MHNTYETIMKKIILRLSFLCAFVMDLSDGLYCVQGDSL